MDVFKKKSIFNLLLNTVLVVADYLNILCGLVLKIDVTIKIIGIIHVTVVVALEYLRVGKGSKISSKIWVRDRHLAILLNELITMVTIAKKIVFGQQPENKLITDRLLNLWSTKALKFIFMAWQSFLVCLYRSLENGYILVGLLD